MTDDIRPEPDRDRYGRYLIVPADGGRPRAHTRATTISDTLDDRHNLENWLQRMAMIGLVVRPSLYAEVASLKPEQRDKLNNVAERSREAAKATSGQELGTALHRFVERVNHGEEVNVPAPWDYDIATYQAAMKAQELGIDQRYLEEIVVLDSINVAGTFDMLVWRDGKLVVADLKTAATLDWSWCSIAAQLAIYAHGETLYDIGTQTHTVMPDVDQETALVVHLPAGQATCTIYEVDIVAGWEAVEHCLWARAWRKKGKATNGLATPLVTWGEKPKPGGDIPPRSEGSDEELVGLLKKRRTFGDEVRARTPTEEKVVTAADPLKVTALEARFDKLDGDRKAWCDVLVAEAKKAGHRFNLSAVASPSLHAYLIGLALVRFAELDPDDRLLRGALENVIGDDLPAMPLGAVLGALTFTQVEALNDLAVAINAGKRSVVYDGDSVQLPAA